MPHICCSIVITCYNLERFVGEAIQSVLDQDASGEVEIIVVDDCSTDGSAVVIQSFSSVRYLCTPTNSGVLLAMVQGIEASTHDIIFLLDGDDIWEPRKLGIAAAAFVGNPGLGLLTHDLSFIDGEGAPIEQTSRPGEVFGPLADDVMSEAVRHGILTLSDYVWLGSALALRRSVVDFAGFAAWMRALPDPRNIYQDWPLAYWAAAQPEVRLGYLNAKLFRYRLHGANHSGDARSVDKALRNVRRTLNTSEAMLGIARKASVLPRYRWIVEQQRTFYSYLVDLYGNRRLGAMASFARSLPHMARRPGLLAKEVVRLSLIVLIGPTRFTAWQASRSG